MRLAVSLFSVLGLSLIGLYLAPVLARAADIILDLPQGSTGG